MMHQGMQVMVIKMKSIVPKGEKYNDNIKKYEKKLFGSKW